MLLKVFQIYYDPLQKKSLDSRFIHYYNNAVSPRFENDVILELYKKEFYKPCDYFGVTSWRLAEKTGLCYNTIETYIQNNSCQIYTYGNYLGRHAVIKNASHYITIILQRLYANNVFEQTNLSLAWLNVWSNYWIVTSEIFEDYMENYFLPAYNFIYSDAVCLKLLKEGWFMHREVKYPLDSFVFEYLFGFFMYHRRLVYSYQMIPNKTGNAQPLFARGII